MLNKSTHKSLLPPFLEVVGDLWSEKFAEIFVRGRSSAWKRRGDYFSIFSKSKIANHLKKWRQKSERETYEHSY